MKSFDAQAALGFVTSQTSHIETQVNETRYPDIQYPGLIPVDTTAHPMAKTVTYYSQDKFGKADWINGNSGDMPVAGTERSKHETAVHMAGIGYRFDWEEIEHAKMLGINLPADDAMAARRAYEEHVDRVALFGDDAKNFKGLVNNSAVTAGSAATGDWEGGVTTEDEVLADINAALLAVSEDTLYSSIADTLLMSPGRLNFLATTRLGDTQMTLLEFIRKNNTYTAMTGQPLTIRPLRGLETAGAGGTQRMIAYRRAPDVLKLHIPMPHRFFPVWQDGPLSFLVPGVFRIGGVDVRRPKELRYSDGI